MPIIRRVRGALAYDLAVGDCILEDWDGKRRILEVTEIKTIEEGPRNVARLEMHFKVSSTCWEELDTEFQKELLANVFLVMTRDDACVETASKIIVASQNHG